MQRYKIIIAYDGSEYAGWQVQPGRKTVQGEIEKAFAVFTRERVIVHGSGRTDQGVHAAGQVIHLDLVVPRSCDEISRALNALLPDDIRALKVMFAKPGFHARRSAIWKQYRYFVWNNEVMPPFIRRYRHHMKNRLDVDAMRLAASMLVGQNDFKAFTANPNRKVESTIRNLTELQVRRSGSEVVITAGCDGFLYKMVRSLAGFLLRVGDGELHPSETVRILNSGLRTAVVPTAPPQGLFLWHVYYG